ncbi:MAG: glycine--tRNA ligase [Verrucomicrobia bacterium]|nr:glycine--tRNA ligase [Verrucomicrobiota bacterium]
MSEPKENVLMEKIVSLCKRRGFVYQSSEIYGGIQGFWDYGPLGAELKRNVKELWWSTMTRLRDDVVGLEATIIMAPQIWRASGHVDTFCDPMCDCLLTKKRFRADQVEPQSGNVFWFIGAMETEAFEECRNLIQENPNQFTCSVEKVVSLLEAGRLVELSGDLAASMQSRDSESPFSVPKLLLKLGPHYFKEYAVMLPPGKPPESARKTALQYYSKLGIKAPKLLGERVEKVENSTRFNPENGSLLTPPVPFNLMFKTYVGPTATEEDVAYLRPETAQAIFAQFKNVLETSRQKVPFGIAQVGKAFRNEVTPRNFTFRSREFEQMELEFFIKPDEAVEVISGAVATPKGAGHPGEPQPSWGWQIWHQYWVEERIKFYEGIGLPRTTLEEYWQKPEELAHYARACVDILFKFPFGTQELEGIAARSDFDLSQHARFSGKTMGVFDEDLRTAWGKLDDAKKKDVSERYYQARLRYLTKSGVEQAKAEKQAKEDAEGLAKGQYIPHVIEPSAGVDRLILALVANAFSEVTTTDDKGKSETRVVMKFHPRVAPIKVGVFPLLKNKPELIAKAKEVFESLRGHMMAFYDDAGAIGRRYARQDEAGTPFCVTIDFDTLGEKPELLNTVTIRHRDDGKQERLPIAELQGWLLARIR